jgi:cyclophilin family peptidyl-prolyl cis-trans isomerase
MSAAALAAPVAPSGLSVFVDRTTANKADPANDTYVFLWNDNSTDETSFVITYNIPGFTPGTLTTVPSTSTSTTGGTGELVFINTNIIPVGTTAQWQVAAVNASGTSTASNVASSTVLAAQLVAPTSVTATVTNENTINVTWSDTSTSAEGNELWLSTNGGAYTYQGDVLFYQAKSINISGLAPGTPYQVKLRAYQDPATQGGARTYTAYSAPSATITTKDGFTSGTAPPIFYNQAFSYQAVVSTGSSRSSWSITGLPTGLTFNSSTGAITGTPTVTGAFNCPMSATFANGWTTNNTLQLRVIRAAAAPVAATTIATQTLAAGGNTSVSLTDKFSDPDSESAVRIVTNLGTMDFILYNSATPQTVTNFLSYVNAAVNNYNGAVFHRSVPGFVVQGGGFKVQSEPNNFSSIPTSASPINEPGISNLRGTVAMAKVGTNPNSATNQFFVNLGNNSSNLDRDSGSPNANGGFTAFARVAGSGMTVADAMAGLPTVNSSVNVDGTPNTSLTDWPLTSASASMDTTKVVSISSAAPVAVLSYAVTGNTNSAVASAAISGTNVQINALSGGQTDVTVTATDLDGNTMAQTFTVTVNQMPAFTNGPPSSTAVVGTAYNFAYTASGFPAPVFSHTGTLPPGLSLSSEGVISGTPTTAGTYSNIVVTASNGVGTAATQTISITVDQIPAITSAAPAAGVVGTAYNHTYAATGSPAPTYSLTAGALPGGLSLSSVGVISGTPTTAGTFTGTITATNLVGSSPQAFSITIQKAAATVALGSLAQTYTGSPLAATSTTTPSNLNVTYTYDGSSTTPTNAGSYAVVATINEPNYTGTASGTLVIAKAAATLSLGGLAQTFDGSAKTVSATTTPAGLTVAFTYNGSATAPTNAGSYAVVGTISEANYSGSDSGTLVIAKAAATVSLGSLAQTYDGSAKAATATTVHRQAWR